MVTELSGTQRKQNIQGILFGCIEIRGSKITQIILL